MARGETYEEFVEKFKTKKTTDDCYTPPEIYNVIKNYVCDRYGITEGQIVRPFWPGGDYETYDYPEGCVVLDNPPFSIFTKICEFYLEKAIPFFLFGPSLTLLAGRNTWDKMNHIVCDATIRYENGAEVRTSFVTNMDEGIIFETCPELSRAINSEVEKLRMKTTRKLPKYVYPVNVVTAALAQKYAAYGVAYKVKRGDATFISRLDAQRELGKAIFGGGLLLSEKATAEKATAEKATATVWELSEREMEIIRGMSRND